MGNDVEKLRGNHAPACKARGALEAACEEKTITKLGREYGEHVIQIRAWKRQWLDGAVDVFESGSDKKWDQEVAVKDRHAKIRELTVERDFVLRKLKP